MHTSSEKTNKRTREREKKIYPECQNYLRLENIAVITYVVQETFIHHACANNITIFAQNRRHNMDYIHAILSRVYLINISRHTRNTQTIEPLTERQQTEKKTKNRNQKKNEMKWTWGEIAVDTHEPHEPHINSSISIHEGASVVECHHSILYLICQIISFIIIIITIMSACSVWMMESCVLDIRERERRREGEPMRLTSIQRDCFIFHVQSSHYSGGSFLNNPLLFFVLIIFQIHYCGRYRCCFVGYEANRRGDCMVMVDRNLFSQYVFINQAWDRTYNWIHTVHNTMEKRDYGIDYYLWLLYKAVGGQSRQ